MGLAAGVVMSALAIDLTDAAVAGAILAAGARVPSSPHSCSIIAARILCRMRQSSITQVCISGRFTGFKGEPFSTASFSVILRAL